MAGNNDTIAVEVASTSPHEPALTLLETTTSATTQNIVNSTTQNIVNSTTPPGFFDQKVLAEAWDTNKATLAWLIPVVVVVVALLVLVSLTLVYMIRGFELWVLKCCNKVCGCCKTTARRLDNEYTHLTAASTHHVDDDINMTEFERDRGSAYRGFASGKKD